MSSRAAPASAADPSGTTRPRKPRRRFLRVFRSGRSPAARPEEDLTTPETSSRPAAVWSEAGSLFSSLADSRSPAMAVARDGTLHVLWEEGSDIYHSYRRDGLWFLPERVATGERPSMVVDKEGTPHAIFANEFGGNWEIYYVTWRYETWTLPRNISHTSGISGNPRLAVAPDGKLHAAWADTTPGYSVIYYARLLGNYWVNNCIPSARGGAPAVAVDAQERVHVAWQDQDTPFGAFDIYYSRWDGTDWSLPENISFNNSAHSAICGLGLDKDGTAHLVWEEQVGDGWQAWCEGTVVRSCRKGAAARGWFPVETIAGNAQGVEDVELATGADGDVHAVWSGRTATGQRDIFHGERAGAMRRHVYFPLTMSQG